MTAVIVMIISTSLFLTVMRHAPGDFSKVEPPHSRMLKSQAFFVHVRAQLLWVYTIGLMTGQSVFLGPMYQILEVITMSIFICRTQLTRETVCPNQEGPCEPQHCWKCWLYVGTTAEETRLPSDVQPCEKPHACDMISHL